MSRARRGAGGTFSSGLSHLHDGHRPPAPRFDDAS